MLPSIMTGFAAHTVCAEWVSVPGRGGPGTDPPNLDPADRGRLCASFPANPPYGFTFELNRGHAWQPSVALKPAHA